MSLYVMADEISPETKRILRASLSSEQAHESIASKPLAPTSLWKLCSIYADAIGVPASNHNRHHEPISNHIIRVNTDDVYYSICLMS